MSVIGPSLKFRLSKLQDYFIPFADVIISVNLQL